MTHFESLQSDDVFVADALSDVALPPLRARRAGALLIDAEAELSRGAARPLTRAEREVARDDPGVPPRVYAPASLRVPRQPLRADKRFNARADHGVVGPLPSVRRTHAPIDKIAACMRSTVDLLRAKDSSATERIERVRDCQT